MKKIYLLFVMLTLALGVFAQSKGKNAMTLRLVDIKVTDGTLVNIAKEQEAKGNTKPMDMIRIYEGNVRAKLDEVAKASGRFEILGRNTSRGLSERKFFNVCGSLPTLNPTLNIRAQSA